MKQLELLTIRKQPLQREPAVRSSVIRNYVRENLKDFPRRQAERERVRKAQYERYAAHTPAPHPRKHHMHTIKVTLRAIFEQPQGILNPLGMKLPGPFPVELFHSRGQWYAREIVTPRRQVYEKLGKFASLDHAKEEVERNFAGRRTPWQIWGIAPGATNERLLEPDEIVDLGNGQFAWYEAKDRTHILHAPNIPPGARVPPAACGAQVKAECFISNRANIRPTCKECAEIWEREYKDR